jgi:hypothetical protein
MAISIAWTKTKCVKAVCDSKESLPGRQNVEAMGQYKAQKIQCTQIYLLLNDKMKTNIMVIKLRNKEQIINKLPEKIRGVERKGGVLRPHFCILQALRLLFETKKKKERGNSMLRRLPTTSCSQHCLQTSDWKSL